MALLVDGPIINLDDLRARDSSLLEMSSLEGVDLTSKITLAQAEIEDLLTSWIRKSDSNGSYELTQVVATEGLRRWCAYRSLELVYQDVHFSQLNDRYGGRWKEYEKLSREASAQYLGVGIGLTLSPLRRPAAPALTTGAGALTSGTYHFQTTWVNARNEESEASLLSTVTIESAHSLAASAVGDPGPATGWHVYAGLTADRVTRQTTTPLSLGAVWQKSGGELAAGVAAGAGQSASIFVVPNRVLRRG